VTTATRPKLTTKRKKKPPVLAVINECCTSCSGSPACQEYCPVEGCMYLVEDELTGSCRIEVDPLLCIGCKKCTSKGPDGAFLDGCPWNAIDMVDTKEWEAEHGQLPY
jgi:ferredoxin